MKLGATGSITIALTEPPSGPCVVHCPTPAAAGRARLARLAVTKRAVRRRDRRPDGRSKVAGALGKTIGTSWEGFQIAYNSGFGSGSPILFMTFKDHFSGHAASYAAYRPGY